MYSGKYYQGKYKLRNPQKYVGDPNNVIYRSSWELKVLVWLDNNNDVLSFSSEELTIPYISPLDGRIHRYFPDFVIKVKTRTGTIKTIIAEVKPYKQTIAPVPPKRKTKSYLKEVMTYGVNLAKWKAAEEYCLDRKWEFMKLTEVELGIQVN